MATLTAADYRELRKAVYRKGDGKEELQALAALPSEAKLLAAFQAFEDFWTNNGATLRSNLQTALGLGSLPSVALTRKIGKAWLVWKNGQGG